MNLKASRLKAKLETSESKSIGYGSRLGLLASIQHNECERRVKMHYTLCKTVHQRYGALRKSYVRVLFRFSGCFLLPPRLERWRSPIQIWRAARLVDEEECVPFSESLAPVSSVESVVGKASRFRYFFSLITTVFQVEISPKIIKTLLFLRSEN